MKNLEIVAKQSGNGITPLYYSIRENAVYTEAGEGRYYLTDLIRKNTEKEIEVTVKRFMSM